MRRSTDWLLVRSRMNPVKMRPSGVSKLEQWRDRALAGIDAGLKERENDPLERQLDEAKRSIGELCQGEPNFPQVWELSFPHPVHA